MVQSLLCGGVRGIVGLRVAFRHVAVRCGGGGVGDRGCRAVASRCNERMSASVGDADGAPGGLTQMPAGCSARRFARLQMQPLRTESLFSRRYPAGSEARRPLPTSPAYAAPSPPSKSMICRSWTAFARPWNTGPSCPPVLPPLHPVTDPPILCGAAITTAPRLPFSPPRPDPIVPPGTPASRTDQPPPLRLPVD